MLSITKYLSLLFICYLNLTGMNAFAEETADPAKQTVNSTQEIVNLSLEPSFLFIQSAEGAKIDKQEGINQYQITLKNVEPWIIYFSERPHRITGFMTTDSFFKLMKKEGKKYEPKGLNVAMVNLDTKHMNKPVTYIFTIHKPQFKNNHQVTYEGNLVPSQNVPSATIIPPPHLTLSHVVLFIDGVCVGCTGPP